jgi:hypothetical protein
MKTGMYFLLMVMFLTGCGTHGALKVAVGPDGPWILTNDGAIYGYNGSVWNQKEAPGTAADLAICGVFLSIRTKPDAQGNSIIKSRDVLSGNWTTYPAIGTVGVKQLACDGYAPVVLTTAPDFSVYKYNITTQSWMHIHTGAKEISVMNSRLFHLYPTTTSGNVWSRNVNAGPYTRWGNNLVANKIAGDANGYPWVATDANTNPLYKWDTNKKDWTFGFPSGPVYEMNIQSYVRMYILSDPQIAGGGYTLYSHELYSGGWTSYSLPSY